MLEKMILHLGLTLSLLLLDLIALLQMALHSRVALSAENLFLRKQLALYQERQVKPRRASAATRLSLMLLARWFDWKPALVVVKPETFLGWHRKGSRLLWTRRSKRLGRPGLPKDLGHLIKAMSRENPTWGQGRIAAELLLKLGIQVSPRTVRKYLSGPPEGGERRRASSQRWMTFVRNHAQAMVACDFFVTVTATFRRLYVFVIIEVGTRKMVHFNVTAHPTAAWTLQQLREALPGEHEYRFLVHDRDSTYSGELDLAVQAMGVKVLKTPVKSPQANCFCERLIGTLRRECLNFIIVLSESHLRRILKEWAAHYNQGRPHSSLGPGFPDPRPALSVPLAPHRHAIPKDHHVIAKPILGGLHHEYRLENIAA